MQNNFAVFNKVRTAVTTDAANACAFVSVCYKCLCVYFWSNISVPAWVHVGFHGITTVQRLPLPTALRGDRGAKGDVTAMSAPCMCLFAPENETPVSLQPPGHV